MEPGRAVRIPTQRNSISLIFELENRRRDAERQVFYLQDWFFRSRRKINDSKMKRFLFLQRYSDMRLFFLSEKNLEKKGSLFY